MRYNIFAEKIVSNFRLQHFRDKQNKKERKKNVKIFSRKRIEDETERRIDRNLIANYFR